MSIHDLWHLAVLGSTLLGAAGAAIVLLAPLLFDTLPPGLITARLPVVGLIALAALLLLGEWLIVH